ncbi:ATP-binding protein [Paenibacillus assamensis]|uniref:sensor histidine kinase n=1 Tax=Paenibacillus assamensis TaxID=311244 RepID=UPI00042A0FAF|nr:ATP-binding protein [Paenibacillus assamensis]
MYWGCFRIKKLSFHAFVALAVLVIIVIQLIGDISQSKIAPQVQYGVLNLRNWNFEKDGAVTLNGKWEFNWNELRTPEMFAVSKDQHYVSIPKLWNQVELNGVPLSGTGYASYRVQIFKNSSEVLLGLWMPGAFSSYNIWVNGKLYIKEGVVADNADAAVPSFRNRLIMIPAPKDKLDLVIQVANFAHHKGGISAAPEIGTVNQMTRKSKLETAKDSLIFGCLFIIGLYQFGMFMGRRREKFTFFFGLLCLAIAVRMLTLGDVMLMYWTSWYRWTGLIRLDYCLITIAVMAGVSFVHYLFKEETLQKFYFTLIGIGLLFLLITLTLSPLLFTSILILYQIYIVFAVVFSIIVTVRAIQSQRTGATITLLGFIIFAVFIFNDILYYQGFAPIRDLAPFGLVICVLMQSLMLSRRISKAMGDVESLYFELRELNAGLETRIEHRTSELVRMNESLESKNDELERMERSRRHLLSNISHDLRTPMTLIRGYLEALYDDVIVEPDEQKKYVKLMLNKINSLNHLIEDLFELSKLEARQVNVEMVDVRLERFISHIEEQYELELRARGLMFACYNLTYRDAPPVSLNLRMDLDRMTQVLDNIIYNAVKFTPTGGKISIRFQYVVSKSCIHISINDTGVGIDSEDLPYIFDRFYKKDKSRNSAVGGSGLGLSIAKEIVELHHGRIWAQSAYGQGSTFHIELPVYDL